MSPAPSPVQPAATRRTPGPVPAGRPSLTPVGREQGSARSTWVLLCLLLPLAGCGSADPGQPPWRGGWLEVAQHPAWRDGRYDGKADQRVHQARFHGDRLAWQAAVTDRNLQQDEYRRARPPVKGAAP